ncbi:geranylgeranyl diphosphate reductase [Chenggangzhangella methanolivorans]|uniref:geranylgeranyl diphosphate reductase n=1 Tax=Chenggangzhangella methanolivorans TaxID=1437009 RepID=A0A9E6R936_9HYPH|nr:geranylgeranyl diphosphate reductase [Chenggangzhangella methanolivorans]QZO00461.1 geranylgeranyl diphosphate reductase [Chenggangzhangella methanolivorans]
MTEAFDVVVVGGGPSGSTAAADLARAGRHVALLDRAGRVKPCGGAIPPRTLTDFDIPESLLVARARSARVIAPSGRGVDMPIDDGFVGMVDREVFDEWLRDRASRAGASRLTGTFIGLERDPDGVAAVLWRPKGSDETQRLRARCVIGADGANSQVARAALPGQKAPFVFAYHEIVEVPDRADEVFDGRRCDIHYDGRFSPDFYSWIFPHGGTASIGTGSAQKGFALRESIAALRIKIGLEHCRTLRREGAPLPLKPLKRWDNGRDVVLIGDAAGVVAPASGEGIWYAMTCGRMAAEQVDVFLATGDARGLSGLRRRFLKQHGRVFFALGILQRFWYASDRRRERFVALCGDPDISRLTWRAYLDKGLVRSDLLAHLRIFFKDLAHLLGIVSPWRRAPGRRA